MMYFAVVAFVLSVLSVSATENPFSTLPVLFEQHNSYGLGKEYDQFRGEVQGLSVVRKDEASANLRQESRRLDTTTNVFEIQHTLSYDGSLIYARGYVINTCTCGLNSTSGTNTCSLVSAKQIGSTYSYNVTFNYFNGAQSCSGSPSSVYFKTYTPSSFAYKACSGKMYYVNETYGITYSYLPPVVYPQGLITYHYGTSASCSSGEFTDYKFSGFTTCGENFLPCSQNTNSSTFYAISANSIGVKTYSDSSCTQESTSTQITATASCFAGTFDDDIDTDVVQNYFSWYVTDYPLNIDVDSGVSLSKSTYGGLIAAVFIAFLVGIALTTCLFHFYYKPKAPLSHRDENNRL